MIDPYWEEDRSRIYQGHVLDVLRELPSESVQCIITSPPYWGLRDYGLPPLEWPPVRYAPMPGMAEIEVAGCEVGCRHEWVDSSYVRNNDQTAGAKQRTNVGSVGRDSPVTAATCLHCGGWRGSLGLEPTPEMYTGHMVLIARELWRVLRDDGTMWMNLGDSYAGSMKGIGSDGKAYAGPKQATNVGSVGIYNDKPPSAGSIGLKPKDLIGIPWRVAFALQADGWYLRNDDIWAKGVSGQREMEAQVYKAAIDVLGTMDNAPYLVDQILSKLDFYVGNPMPECLDPSTKVFVRRQGWVSHVSLAQVEQMSDFPEILSHNGWVKIRHLWRTTKPAIYMQAGKVESIICSPEHRFPISSDRRRKRVHLDTAENIRHEGYADYLLYCPVDKFLSPTLCSWMGKELGYALGYLIGAYTAEGGKGGSRGFRIKITIGIHEQAFAEKIRACAEQLGVAFSEYEHPEHHYMDFQVSEEWLTRTINMFVSGDVHTKALSIELILNTPHEFRQGILDGYVDGDGSLRHGKGWIIASASKRLRDDISTLASSLGIITSKGKSSRQDHRTGKTYHAHSLWTPYMTRRKHKSGMPGVYQVPPRRRKLLEGEREMIDIEVDGGLFLIGDGLVTHNSVRDRCTRSHEYVFMLAKSERYFCDMEAIKEPSVGQAGQAANFARDTKDHIIPGQSVAQHREDRKPTKDTGKRNRRTVWTIPTQGRKEAHFATFPDDLIEPMIKAGTSEKGCCAECGAPWKRVIKKSKELEPGRTNPGLGKVHDHAQRNYVPGGDGSSSSLHHVTETKTISWKPTCSCNAGPPVPCTLLDPFGGRGTTAEVAIRHGRRAWLIELNPEYCEMAKGNLEKPIKLALF